MNRNLRSSLLAAFAAFLLVPAASAAEGGNPLLARSRKRPADAPPTVVTSDKLEFDYENWVALFEGRVVVTDPEFTLKADRMLIVFENTNDVKSVACIGNVDMKSDDIHVVCGKATYTRINAHVLLEETPVVTKGTARGEQKLSGRTIDLWLDDGRVQVNDDVAITARPDSFKEDRKKEGGKKEGK